MPTEPTRRKTVYVLFDDDMQGNPRLQAVITRKDVAAEYAKGRYHWFHTAILDDYSEIQYVVREVDKRGKNQ